MRRLFIVSMLFCGFYSYAQKVVRTVELEGKSLTLESTLEKNNVVDVTVKKDGETKGSFKVNADEALLFEKGVLAQLDPVDATALENNQEVKEKMKNEFNATLQALLAQIGKDAPKAGTLKTSATAPYYHGKNRNTDQLRGDLIIKDIKIVFYDGYIQKIDVYGECKEDNGDVRRTRFTNKYGIGFTRDKNFRNLKRIALFDADSHPGSEGDFVKLGDILKYEPSIDLLTLEYSPSDRLINTEGGKIVDLYREESQKLLEGSIYTDLIGLAEDKPNGLIQTEISRKFHVNIGRKSPRHFFRSYGMGSFQYIRPSIVFSKIEGKERRYKPMAQEAIVDSTQISRNIFVRPLDLLEYQNLSLGVDLNLFVLDHANYMLYVNAGLRFNKTAVSDSLARIENNALVRSGNVDEFTLNYFTVYPELVFQLLPEKRISFEMIYRLTYFAPAFDNAKLFRLEGGQSKFDTEKQYRWFHTFHAGFTLRTNDDNKLFARYRYNCEMNNFTQSFHQLQLGYAFYLLAPKSKS